MSVMEMRLNWMHSRGLGNRIARTVFMSAWVCFSGCGEGGRSVHDAAWEGDLQAVKRYIEADQVDVESKDRFGNEILFHAVSGNHMDVVRYLVEQGASPLIRSGDGSTLVHIAAGLGETNMVAYLLQQLCPIDEQDVNGETPLMFAVLAEHRGMVDFLVAKGASMTVTNQTGQTPLQVALKKGWSDLAVSPESKALIPQPTGP